jgi:hypothetical protein
VCLTFFSVGIEEVMYNWDRYFIHSSDCVEKIMCALMLILFDVYVEGINLSVIHSAIQFSEHPMYFWLHLCLYESCY